MAPGRRHERSSRAEEIFEAHMARHHAHLDRAMAAHDRAMAAVERQMSLGMRAHQRAVEAVERSLEEALGRGRARRSDLPSKDDIKRRWGKRRPDAEGGDPIPAVPRPKPKPLAGAAAAEIE